MLWVCTGNKQVEFDFFKCLQMKGIKLIFVARIRIKIDVINALAILLRKRRTRIFLTHPNSSALTKPSDEFAVYLGSMYNNYGDRILLRMLCYCTHSLFLGSNKKNRVRIDRV